MTSLPPRLADQLAPALTRQQALVERLQAHLRRFGYAPIATPLIEQADLFLIKAGDAAINRLMTFDLPGKTLCLRPEFTVPAARAYIAHFQDQADAARLQFTGPILHHERLGHNQIIQETALGGELINHYGPAADAETIAATAQLLDIAGITSWRLVIGHSGLILRLLDRYPLNRQMRRFALAWLPRLRNDPDALAAAEVALQKRSPDAPSVPLPAPPDSPDTEAALQAMLHATPARGPLGGRSRDEIARRLLNKQQQGDQQVHTLSALRNLQALLRYAESPAALAEHLATSYADPALDDIATDLVQTVDLLSAYNVPTEQLSFDLSFTRNLDYYTGIVFEFRAVRANEADLLLAGGGRYDELIRLLGAQQDVPAVGFMLYVDHVLNLTQAATSASAKPTHVRLTLPSLLGDNASDLLQTATWLRERGIIVSTQSATPPAAAIPAAANYTHMLHVEAGKLIAHNLHTGATQSYPPDDLPALLTFLEAGR